MRCPKCKARVGIMSQQLILVTGVVECSRCVICGYLAIDHSRKHIHSKTNKRMPGGTA